MTSTPQAVVRLSRSDLALLIESLDSHEYWQLGDVMPRDNGFVFLPGDMQPDRFWEHDKPSAEQRTAIDEIGRCRRLADQLRAALDLTPPTDG